jgi:hypothetical protein
VLLITVDTGLMQGLTDDIPRSLGTMLDTDWLIGWLTDVKVKKVKLPD